MRRRLEPVIQDVGYAVRSFRRSPAFTFVAVLSLMLGIGATTAIFSVIYGILIAPYPYAKPEEIWAPSVCGQDGRGGRAYLPGELRRLAELPVFADVMATSIETVLMTGEFAPESFNGVLLSGNAFNFLGVPPVAGRTIQPTDIQPNGDADPVVPAQFSQDFAAALRTGGHQVALSILPGVNHGEVYSAAVAAAPVVQWLRSLPQD